MDKTITDACSKLLSSRLTAGDFRLLFGLVVIFVIVAGVAVLRRIFTGDELEIGKWVRLKPSAQVKDLSDAVRALSRDDKLKQRVLWLLRDHMVTATPIVEAGFQPDIVRQWAQRVVADVTAALSRGGEDRHRAALWYADEPNAPFRM